MKALVKFAQEDGCTEIRDVPVPDIGPEDVLVKVMATGVCGSDIHMHHNQVTYKVNTPLILGHEFAGVIEAVGNSVFDYSIGERVTAETHADFCGRCVLCRTGHYNICAERKGFGFHVDGAFTNYVRVPERILHRVPPGVSLEEAALTEPLCVAYNALVNKTDIRPGDPVVIIGPGPIGLFCIQIARVLGATPIIVIGAGSDGKRLETARLIGGDFTIDATMDDPVVAVSKLLGGRGAPTVVDCAGSSETLAFSLDMVCPNGQITKIGWGPDAVGFSLDTLIAKAARLQGSFSHTWETWEKCLGLMAAGKVDTRALITHDLSIDRWLEGFGLIETKEAIKVLLRPL